MEVVLGRERGDEERDEYDDDEWKQGVVDWGSSGPFQATLRALACTGIQDVPRVALVASLTGGSKTSARSY